MTSESPDFEQAVGDVVLEVAETEGFAAEVSGRPSIVSVCTS